VVELRGGPRGPGPPERPGGPLETPGLRGYKGASKRPPEITCKIQYMIATYQYHSMSNDGDGDAPSLATRLINHPQLLARDSI